MKTIKKFLIIVFTSVMLTATGISSVAGEQPKERCRITVVNNQTGESNTFIIYGYTCGELIAKIVEVLMD